MSSNAVRFYRPFGPATTLHCDHEYGYDNDRDTDPVAHIRIFTSPTLPSSPFLSSPTSPSDHRIYFPHSSFHVRDHLAGPAVEEEGAAEYGHVAEGELWLHAGAAGAGVRHAVHCYGPSQLVLLSLQLLHLGGMSVQREGRQITLDILSEMTCGRWRVRQTSRH